MASWRAAGGFEGGCWFRCGRNLLRKLPMALRRRFGDSLPWGLEEPLRGGLGVRREMRLVIWWALCAPFWLGTLGIGLLELSSLET